MKEVLDQIKYYFRRRVRRTRSISRPRKSIRHMKKRREMRMRFFMSVLLCFMLIGLAATYNTKAAEKERAAEAFQAAQQKQKLESKAEETAKKMEGNTISTRADTETARERLERVRKEAEEKEYPEDIIELLDKNKETVAFVENYEKKCKDAPAETIGDDFEKGEIPSLLQWDQRWGYAAYGTGFVATCGCGPTCMAMVVSGLKEDPSVTPAVLAKYSEQEGYIDENNNTYWTLMESGGQHWGISSSPGSTDEDSVAAALEKGHPIICSVGPGDFTEKGHFIVLTKYKDGKVKVNDPFSTKNSKKTWEYAKIKDQIKALWIYENADEK